jgi:hypothetical protein
MRIEYSKRATSDLKKISRYYRDSAGPTVLQRSRLASARSWRGLRVRRKPEDPSFNDPASASCCCSGIPTRSSTGFSEIRSA